MIVMVDIEKAAPGCYVAQARCGGVECAEAVTYGRIDEAIAEQAGAMPDDFAPFIQFTYGGMSTETLQPEEAVSRAVQLADRLMVLQAVAHQHNENAK
jgi:hypothetical protein